MLISNHYPSHPPTPPYALERQRSTRIGTIDTPLRYIFPPRSMELGLLVSSLQSSDPYTSPYKVHS
jgi:hypothetical protein